MITWGTPNVPTPCVSCRQAEEPPLGFGRRGDPTQSVGHGLGQVQRLPILSRSGTYSTCHHHIPRSSTGGVQPIALTTHKLEEISRTAAAPLSIYYISFCARLAWTISEVAAQFSCGVELVLTSWQNVELV